MSPTSSRSRPRCSSDWYASPRCRQNYSHSHPDWWIRTATIAGAAGRRGLQQISRPARLICTGRKTAEALLVAFSGGPVQVGVEACRGRGAGEVAFEHLPSQRELLFLVRELVADFSDAGEQFGAVALGFGGSGARLEAAAKRLGADYGVTVLAVPLDVSREQAPEQLVERLKEERIEIEILVNNAGAAVAGPAAETDPAACGP